MLGVGVVLGLVLEKGGAIEERKKRTCNTSVKRTRDRKRTSRTQKEVILCSFGWVKC